MFLRKTLPYIAAAVLIAALWLRGEWHARRADTSEIQLKSAIAISRANAALAAEHAQLGRKIDATAAVNALHKRDIYLHSDIRRKAITNAPSEDDGPLAPVLRDQLERLPIAPGADAPCRGATAADPGDPPHSNGGTVPPADVGDTAGRSLCP